MLVIYHPFPDLLHCIGLPGIKTQGEKHKLYQSPATTGPIALIDQKYKYTIAVIDQNNSPDLLDQIYKYTIALKDQNKSPNLLDQIYKYTIALIDQIYKYTIAVIDKK